MSRTVRELGERGLIEAIADRNRREGLVVDGLGIGDDCAVVRPRPGRELLLEVDEAVEGVHFRFDWMTAEDVGHRLATQGLSDIAAMGGTPLAMLLALGLADDTPVDRVLDLVTGLVRQGARFAAPLAGGNITRTPDGLHATVTVVGDVESGRAVLRSGARAGDTLWVTGQPGLARAGWTLLERGIDATIASAAAPIERFRRPSPRLDEARFLVDTGGVHAMIDVSDGLSGDLEQVAIASRVAMEIDLAAVPVGEALANAARLLDRDPRQLALAGGDDFELLLAGDGDVLSRNAAVFEARFGSPLTRIGRVVPGSGNVLIDVDGTRLGLVSTSYRHFARDAL